MNAPVALPTAARAVALLAVLAFFAATAAGVQEIRFWLKPLPVLVLAWAALRAAGGARAEKAPPSRFALLVAAGLGLSAVGDILLELPGGFVRGLVAFLLAHVAYVLAFASDCRSPALLRGLPCLLFGAFYFGLLRARLGALELPVAVYVTVICTMLWRALARADRGPSGVLGALGALSFVVSDSLLAWNRFMAPFAAASYAVIATYWLGQAGIAAAAWHAAYSDSSSPEAGPARETR
ncbi:MAG: lysoplasmalogenase [Vicinamibacteria bacterium]|nr:lysoplasmalogenase [Vicinamibacteria bacterium]